METEKKKLTDNQLRIFQAVAAVLCAAALMITISLSSSMEGIFQYAFLVIFVIITFGRRWVENKFRLRLNFFNLILIDSIMVGILIYLIAVFYNPAVNTGLSDTIELLIVIGVVILILVLGFGLPYRTYLKRKEKGTLVPIRIPEKTEEEKEAERNNASSGQSSIARQIAEMTKELDAKEGENKPDNEQ
jgi:hypothetical protein